MKPVLVALAGAALLAGCLPMPAQRETPADPSPTEPSPTATIVVTSENSWDYLPGANDGDFLKSVIDEYEADGDCAALLDMQGIWAAPEARTPAQAAAKIHIADYIARALTDAGC